MTRLKDHGPFVYKLRDYLGNKKMKEYVFLQNVHNEGKLALIISFLQRKVFSALGRHLFFYLNQLLGCSLGKIKN